MHRGSAIAGVLALGVLTAAPPALAQEKYALAMFHFNLQYVAGGLVGFTVNADPSVDKDENEVADLIVTESIEPVIDIFERHPAWGAEFGMQAEAIDFMAARHPQTLDRLRALAKAGQIEVVSFTYGHSLLIGFPQEDLERSQPLVVDTFANHDIPLGKSVFCQEGQGAVGIARLLDGDPYRTLIFPKNLWIYQHGDFDAMPLYRLGDGYMIIGAKGVSYNAGGKQVELVWSFFDDGEKLSTGDLNPYFIEVFREDPAKVAAYEQSLISLEAQGFKISSVDAYVDAMLALGITPVDPPPLMDGTWQPGSTGGVTKWFGGEGLWFNDERDNHVRSLQAMAHRELVAAETIAAQAGLDARAALDGGWRMLSLAEVSDASGINPYRGEVEYGIAHATEALRVARDVINDGKQALGMSSVLIDPKAGAVSEGSAEPFAGQSVNAPLSIQVTLEDREVSESWSQIGPGHYRVDLHFATTESPAGRFVTVRFPGDISGKLYTTRANEDDKVASFDRADFDLQEGEFQLALPLGLIGLGNGWFVIKDQALVHLAAAIRDTDGDVEFKDQTMPLNETVPWAFHLFQGTPEEAAALARDINGRRVLAR